MTWRGFWRGSAAAACLLASTMALTTGASAQSGGPGARVPGITEGPATVGLGESQGKLALPAKGVFLDATRARQMLKESGEGDNENVVGIVSDSADDTEWNGIVSYIDCGYVRDDEADKLNADDLLNDIRKGTERNNVERREKGVSEVEVVGWAQPPTYDRAKHILYWAVIGKDRASGDQVVNMTTMLLGRHGILSTTIVGDNKDRAKLGPKQQAVNAAITFPQGRDYASFRSGDRVAEITMTGLVTGGAAAAAYGAAKTGLFAKLGVLLLGLKKGAFLLIAGAAALVKKLWNKLSGRGHEDNA